jgi:hypothetical protein
MAITEDKFENAIAEATRFIKTAAILKASFKDDRRKEWHWSAPRECGAVRRSSLDLSRCLADLRKST